MRTNGKPTGREPDFFMSGIMALCTTVADLSRRKGIDALDPHDCERYTKILKPILEVCGLGLVDLKRTGSMALMADIHTVLRRQLRENNSAELTIVETRQSPWKLLDQFGNSAYAQIKGMPKLSKNEATSIAVLGRSLALSEKSDGRNDIRRIVWGLALIGCAKVQWDAAHFCEFCFRHAWPGFRFCRFHSQTRKPGESAAKRFAAYRAGAKAKSFATDRGIAIREDLNGLDRRFYIDPNFIWALFPEAKPNYADGRIDFELVAALRASPRVLVKLGGRLVLKKPYAELVSIFSKRLNPDTLEAPNAALVRIAEIWLQLEEEATPTHRGKGTKTLALVDRAVIIAREGYSKTEIAKELGVAKSTISTWLQRYPNFCEAFLRT